MGYDAHSQSYLLAMMTECIHYTYMSSDIKTLYLRYVRSDIAECFMTISEQVRDAIFSHVLPK